MVYCRTKRNHDASTAFDVFYHFKNDYYWNYRLGSHFKGKRPCVAGFSPPEVVMDT